MRRAKASSLARPSRLDPEEFQHCSCASIVNNLIRMSSPAVLGQPTPQLEHVVLRTISALKSSSVYNGDLTALLQ